MLKLTLLANAASCAIFGLVFSILGHQTANFLGDPPVAVLQILGVLLILNATALLIVAIKEISLPIIIMMFVFGDLAWVLVTVVLLIMGIWVTTASGILASIGVAGFVGMCGLLQWWYMPVHNA